MGNSYQERLQRFLLRFNQKYGDGFSYINGYKDSESPVVIRCKKCGYEFERNANYARHYKNITCPNCAEIALSEKRKREAEQNGIAKDERAEERRERRRKQWAAKHTKRCKECNAEFIAEHNNVKYCSGRCRNKNKRRLTELRRRNAYKGGRGVDHDITLDKLVVRDKSTCQLCGNPVDTNDCVWTNDGHFIAGEIYPSIDHITPISRGGAHTWGNVQLAHRHCNALKNNKESPAS